MCWRRCTARVACRSSPTSTRISTRPPCAHGTSLFDALNRIADTLRLRWTKDGEWLQFRSTSFYDDRLKEVPNRLLSRWSASRREHGALTLDDLIEIAQLSDVQLNAREMAKGALVLWGLEEWDLARGKSLQPYSRPGHLYPAAAPGRAPAPPGCPSPR